MQFDPSACPLFFLAQSVFYGFWGQGIEGMTMRLLYGRPELIINGDRRQHPSGSLAVAT